MTGIINDYRTDNPIDCEIPKTPVGAAADLANFSLP